MLSWKYIAVESFHLLFVILWLVAIAWAPAAPMAIFSGAILLIQAACMGCPITMFAGWITGRDPLAHGSFIKWVYTKCGRIGGLLISASLLTIAILLL